MQEVLQHDGASRMIADQGQLGQQTDDGVPLRKPTGGVSNDAELLAALNRRCFGKHGLSSRPQRSFTLSAQGGRRSARQPSTRSCASPPCADSGSSSWPTDE